MQYQVYDQKAIMLNETFAGEEEITYNLNRGEVRGGKFDNILD